MICNFVVGQRVVCVRDDWCATPPECRRPMKGEICKIESMTPDPVFSMGYYVKPMAGIWLILAGFPNSTWTSAYFRPLQDRPTQTDISVFDHLLDPTLVPELTP